MPKGSSSAGNGAASSLRDLPRPQKVAVVIFAVLAVIIVGFWIWQIRAQINGPFAPYDVASTATSTDLNTLLKSRDTDGDGLSDYDEIYVYHTSPYLADSDSDGISDKQEILNGTDPNCPQGKDCSATENSASSTATVPSLTPPADLTTATSTPTLDSSGADQSALQSALNGQIDATTLRQLLISSGANPADLSKISDADLMASYQATLQKQNQATTTPAQ